MMEIKKIVLFLLFIGFEVGADRDTTHLMEKVVAPENLKIALKHNMRRRTAKGIDGVAIEQLPLYLMKNWENIEQQLLTGTYKPKEVRRIEIPKSNGGKRPLGIATVLDRFVQRAVLQVIAPIIDETFSESSYGYRPGRSIKDAVDKSLAYIQEGKRFVVSLDIEKFFDQIDHEILLKKFSSAIKDERIITLVNDYLKAGIELNGRFVPTNEGVCQGWPMSPILANLMLDELDKELERRNLSFVRCADDCTIYVANKQEGYQILDSLKTYVEQQLKLSLNSEKSVVIDALKLEFLGFSFQKADKKVCAVATPKKAKKKVQLANNTPAINSINKAVDKIILKTNEKVTTDKETTKHAKAKRKKKSDVLSCEEAALKLAQVFKDKNATNSDVMELSVAKVFELDALVQEAQKLGKEKKQGTKAEKTLAKKRKRVAKRLLTFLNEPVSTAFNSLIMSNKMNSATLIQTTLFLAQGLQAEQQLFFEKIKDVETKKNKQIVHCHQEEKAYHTA